MNISYDELRKKENPVSDVIRYYKQNLKKVNASGGWKTMRNNLPNGWMLLQQRCGYGRHWSKTKNKNLLYTGMLFFLKF